MYAPNPPSQPEPDWPRPATAPGIPPPPTYLPQPVPPQTYPVEREEAARTWLRIPLARPVLTPLLLALLVLIYIPMAVSFDLNESFLNWGAKENDLITAGQWYRMVTAMFLHGGLLHILLNGYALYMIGVELEGFFGMARFAAVYFISGFAGNVASYAFSPHPGVGASGAIFGIVGALAVYYGLHRGLFGRIGQAQFWNIMVVIGINVAIGFSGIFPIDNSAHLGGLVAGVALGYVLCPRYTLGEWFNPLVRRLRDANSGSLPWLATALIGLIVFLAFLVVWLLFRSGASAPIVGLG